MICCPRSLRGSAHLPGWSAARHTGKREVAMKVSDVMTEAVVTVRSDASLQEAAALMVQHRVSGLPVVDTAGVLAGMLTEGDVIRRAELGTAGKQPGWLSIFLSPGRAAQD